MSESVNPIPEHLRTVTPRMLSQRIERLSREELADRSSSFFGSG